MHANSRERGSSQAAAQIRKHVVGLFDAYLAGDRDALKAGRSRDWKGFQIRSTKLVRGVSEYMAELERVLGSLKVERYEFLDFDVDVFGDLALVFYVARDWLDRTDAAKTFETRSVLVRSLDVYQRIDGEWTQIASNICSIADPVDT